MFLSAVANGIFTVQTQQHPLSRDGIESSCSEMLAWLQGKKRKRKKKAKTIRNNATQLTVGDVFQQQLEAKTNQC